LWRTVSVGEPAGPAHGARLKVKLGGPDDGAVLDALAGTEAQVIVDVNRGWTPADVSAHRARLRRVPLVALEDPVADPAQLPTVRSALPGVPVLLDEGVRTVEQAEDAARRADGANVKLVKFGGLLEADRALRRLGELGARRMLGCFVEPPRAIAYAAQLAGRAEWADLDGHLLLDGGPQNGVLVLDSSAPGIPRLAGAEGDT
jgi:L-alanine-DL-glutamate epimerase-like enolase superfamily enzyme